MLRDAATLIDNALVDFCEAVVALAEKHRDTVMIGRTHGMHAEPTTFGAKVALWALQLRRDRDRLDAATKEFPYANFQARLARIQILIHA